MVTDDNTMVLNDCNIMAQRYLPYQSIDTVPFSKDNLLNMVLLWCLFKKHGITMLYVCVQKKTVLHTKKSV